MNFHDCQKRAYKVPNVLRLDKHRPSYIVYWIASTPALTRRVFHVWDFRALPILHIIALSRFCHSGSQSRNFFKTTNR
jgi:hypothetical protein